MRSRAARLTLSALAWIAMGGAAFFSYQTLQQVNARRAAQRTFEATARDASDALADAQAAQQAYVAAGQTASDWADKLSTYLQTAGADIDTLRASATSAPAGPALLDASTAVTQFGHLDRRVRASVADGDMHDAADMIFSEGVETVANAASQIQAAIGAEQQAADAFTRARERQVIYAAAGAALFAAFVLATLGIVAPGATAAEADNEAAEPAGADSAAVRERLLGPIAPASEASDAVDLPQASPAIDALRTAADLCTGFSRAREAGHLEALLDRAAGAMNARGVIVWLGSPAGADLRPVLAHGYSDQTLARLASIPRSAQNAAAAAYRTGETQSVAAQPAGAIGAVVAPLLAGDDCIGALSAEIRDGGESSEVVRAVATIVAAQLAAVLATSATDSASAPQPHSAAG